MLKRNVIDLLNWNDSIARNSVTPQRAIPMPDGADPKFSSYAPSKNRFSFFEPKPEAKISEEPSA